jgi:hypothetical protein
MFLPPPVVVSDRQRSQALLLSIRSAFEDDRSHHSQSRVFFSLEGWKLMSAKLDQESMMKIAREFRVEVDLWRFDR